MTDKITDSGFVSEEEIKACLEKLEAHIQYEAKWLGRFNPLTGESEDIAQELRLAAYRALKAWKPGNARMSTWAANAVDFRVRVLSRSSKRASAHRTIALVGGCDEGVPVPTGTIREEDIPADPDEMQRVIFRADICAAVERLKPELRKAAKAVMASGNLSEAAALVGKSRTAFVRTVLPRLREALMEAGFSADSI